MKLNEARICLACGTTSTGGMPRFVLTCLKHMHYPVTVVEPGCSNINEIRNQIEQLPNVGHINIVPLNQLPDFITEGKYDLIHYHDWPTRGIRPLGIRSIQTLHSTIKGYALPVHKHIMLSDAQRVVYPEISNPHVLGSLVDTSVFYPRKNKDMLRVDLGLPLHRKIVTCIGIVARHKQQDWLVRNWNLDATLLLVGPLADNFKEYWQSLKSYVHAAGKPVIFIGATAHPELYINAADAVVSASELEGLCLSNLEASACGIPLVIKNIPQNAIVYKDKETAWLCSKDNMMEVLNGVLNKPNDYDVSAVITRGLNMVKTEYTPETYVTKVEGLYQELLNNPLPKHEPVLNTVNSLENRLRDLSYHKAKCPDIHTTFFGAPEIRVSSKVGPVRVIFSNTKTQKKVYSVNLNSSADKNSSSYAWARPNYSHHIPWHILVHDLQGNVIYERKMSLKQQRVLVVLDSSAIGDTLAWTAQALSFAKQYDTDLVLMSAYPEMLAKLCKYNCIGFGQTPENIDFMFRIGLHDSCSTYPGPFRNIPIQQIASNILGINYQECHLDLTPFKTTKVYDTPYICIAPQSTMAAKEWLYPFGWRAVIDYLKTTGYMIVNLTNNGVKFDDVINFKGTLAETANVIGHSRLLIGLSSGLSWVAHGMNIPVIMISGFTMPYTEFTHNVTRIQNTTVCHGCWTDSSIPFERYWNWCPRKCDFECTKQIHPDSVIAAVKQELEKDRK